MSQTGQKKETGIKRIRAHLHNISTHSSLPARTHWAGLEGTGAHPCHDHLCLFYDDNVYLLCLSPTNIKPHRTLPICSDKIQFVSLLENNDKKKEPWRL